MSPKLAFSELSRVIRQAAHRAKGCSFIGSFALILFAAAVASRLWLSKRLDPIWTLPVDGLLGDLATAVGLAVVAVMLAQWSWKAAAGFILAWALITIGNAEHIYALDAPLRLENYRFAVDETFLRGSAAQLVSWRLALVVVLFAGGLILYSKRIARLSPTALVLAIVLAIASGAGSWRQASNATDWRRASPLVMMFTRVAKRDAVIPTASVNTDLFFRRDTKTGAPLAPRTKKAKNVLMLVLEGLPGVYLRSVQRATGLRTPIEMPKLSDIVEDGMVVPHFVAHTHGTIFGLYALYCGDYDFFNETHTVKPYLMRTLPVESRPQCLPQRLKEEGYRTAFLQAADLEYMVKSQVMPIMGFDRVTGRDSMEKTENFWGVDDKQLLEKTLAEIEKLDQTAEPWFLSILTVGTHHPFLAPPEYIERYGDNKTAAVRYLDDELATFIDQLEARGVLEDTLVVFTSDESHGVPGHPFGANWSMAAMIGPGIEPSSFADGNYGHLDMAVSVLDYLDLLDEDQPLLGRSFFRRYESPRGLLFGEFAHVDGLVMRCQSAVCSRYLLQDNQLLAADYRVKSGDTPGDDESAGLYYGAFTRAVGFHGNDELRDHLLLVQDVDWNSRRSMALSKAINLPPNSVIEVILDMENLDSAQMAAVSWFLIENSYEDSFTDRLPAVQLPLLLPKSRLLVKYTLANKEAHKMWAVLMAESHTGEKPINLKLNNIQVWKTAQEGHAPFKLESLDLSFPIQIANRFDTERFFVTHATAIGAADDTPKGAQTRGQPNAAGNHSIVPRYRLGETIDFSDKSDWRPPFFLAGGWLYPEKWGIWSDGKNPSLSFHLEEVDPDARYEMRFEVIPYISPPLVSEQNIGVILNSRELGRWRFVEQQIKGRSVTVPGSALVANDLNTLTFDVSENRRRMLAPENNPSLEDSFGRQGIGLIRFAIHPLSK